MAELDRWLSDGVGQVRTGSPFEGTDVSAAVGQGGANRRDDVLTVQSLLNRAGSAVAGPRKQIAADGQVGPETIGAIREFQTRHLGFNDGRVDPGGPTIRKLNFLVAQAGPRQAAETVRFNVRDGAPRTRMQAALEAVPLAQFWTTAALAHVRVLHQGFQASSGLVLPFVFDVINTHFHLDRDPSSILLNLDKLVRRFSLISQMLSRASELFVEGDTVRETDKDGNPVTIFADAPFGGFHQQPNVTLRVTIRPPYVRCGLNTRAAMLVHEAAHFVGGNKTTPEAIRHFAAEFPTPQGKAVETSTHNYQQLTAAEAMTNASSYAAFAIHAATGIDSRFGGRDISQ